VAALFVMVLLPWRPESEVVAPLPERPPRVDPSVDSCAACHHRATPGIVAQWVDSQHAVRGVTCGDCHETTPDNPYAFEHVGSHVATVVTPRVCAECHPLAVEEFSRSRHSLPAWASLTGTSDFASDEALMAQWGEAEAIPEGDPNLVLSRRETLFTLEGPQVTPLACERCHEIGRPNLDGSAGQCSKCHLRHRFSLEQARRPEICNSCHTGTDQPQWEIYSESHHGIIYQTETERFRFDHISGRAGVRDYPSPTCQLCHMSGFGRLSTTHDVSERLAWHLNQPIAIHREDHESRREAMREICRQCHSTEFIDEQFEAGDAIVEWTNERVAEANAILEGLIEEGLISSGEFEHPLHHLGFELWHYYGRTARFAALMQGPDHTQWHGIYPLMRTLDELEQATVDLQGENTIADVGGESGG
jgi:hypothetical protein